MALKAEVIDRLLLSKSFLGRIRYQPTASPDRHTVAAQIVGAHDAAELAVAAICDELNCLPQQGVSYLMHYFDALKKAKHPNQDVLDRNYFVNLNDVRNAIKHRGQLPDTKQWSSVGERTFQAIDGWCKQYLDVSFAEIDALYLIEDHKVQGLVKEAKEEIAKSAFKKALEKLSEALFLANLSYRHNLHIMPGVPDPQLALILSGYGVDPSAFIVMQQLLPTIAAKGIKWNLHGTGHPFNWKDENVRFCIEAVVRTIILLQEGLAKPMPVQFYDVYRDVVTITEENPTVRRGNSSAILSDFDVITSTSPVTIFSKGDKIHGRLSAAADMDGQVTCDAWEDFDHYKWLKLTDPMCEKCGFSKGDFLMLLREQTDISYEEYNEPEESQC